MMESDMWATLPCDLLVEIFRRLGQTAVVRCAGACRQWRHAIIANARCLRPRPDRFVPDLLLGFLLRKWNGHLYTGPLQYVPAPFENVLTSDAADAPVRFFAPAATACGVDFRLYDTPLSPPRDGFVLLGGSAVNDLCLCNPLTGIYRFLPAAQNWLPGACCPNAVWLRAFCPRSGCIIVCVDGQDLVVAVDSRSSPQPTATTRLVGDGTVDGIFRYPYEVDWSTYISKMKYF